MHRKLLSVIASAVLLASLALVSEAVPVFAANPCATNGNLHSHFIGAVSEKGSDAGQHYVYGAKADIKNRKITQLCTDPNTTYGNDYYGQTSGSLTWVMLADTAGGGFIQIGWHKLLTPGTNSSNNQEADEVYFIEWYKATGCTQSEYSCWNRDTLSTDWVGGGTHNYQVQTCSISGATRGCFYLDGNLVASTPWDPYVQWSDQDNWQAQFANEVWDDTSSADEIAGGSQTKTVWSNIYVKKATEGWTDPSTLSCTRLSTCSWNSYHFSWVNAVHPYEFTTWDSGS